MSDTPRKRILWSTDEALIKVPAATERPDDVAPAAPQLSRHTQGDGIKNWRN